MEVDTSAGEEASSWTVSSNGIDTSPYISLLVMEADTFSAKSVKRAILVKLLHRRLFGLLGVMSISSDSAFAFGY